MSENREKDKNFGRRLAFCCLKAQGEVVSRSMVVLKLPGAETVLAHSTRGRLMFWRSLSAVEGLPGDRADVISYHEHF